MSVTVAPLRLLMIGLSLLLAWPLAALAVGFRSEEERKQPLSGWRRISSILSAKNEPFNSFSPGGEPMGPVHFQFKSLGIPLRALGRVMTFFMSFQKVKVVGIPARPDEAPVLVCAPHSTLLDTMVLFHLSCIPSGVSREENSEIPVLSALLNFTQPVLVKREDPNSRQKTVEEIQRRAKTNGEWPQIIIFPEGTCTNRTCLITFKLGAFHPGVPVQPVCLKYPNRIDTITWTWEGPGAFTLLWLTLCQFNTNLEIEFLPVYKPSPEEIADPKLYANNVRNVMAKALGIPVTDHTYDDCRLMMKARALNLPMEAGLVEFQKLHKKLGINLDQMDDMLEKFNKIDLSGKGHITLDQFARYLQLPASDALKEIFNVYDRSGTGTIDFREYVIGLSLVSAPANTDSTISLAFQLFDSSQQGYISQEDLFSILHDAFGMTEIDIEELFTAIDEDKDNRITYEEFKSFAQKKPEYAPLFLAYQNMKKVEGDTNGNAKTQPSLSPISESNDEKSPVCEADKNHPKSE